MKILAKVFRLGRAYSHRTKTLAASTSLSTLLVLVSTKLGVGASDSCTAQSTAVHTSSQLLQQSVDQCDHSTDSMSSSLEKAKAGSLWGLFVADSLAMPVHWYYNPADIKRGYDGWLTGYRAPNKHHPSSILTLSAVDGSGRTGWAAKSKTIIGDIILHDKLKYWTSGDRSTHYHQGMKAGDSTLNALTALETVKVMQRVDPDATLDPRSLQAEVMQNYVQFMTTPGSHNDTYAESFHRKFFQDWSRMDNPPRDGESIVKMAEERYKKVSRSSEDSQLPVIGALVIAVPWVLHYAHKSANECSQYTVSAVRLTHPAPSLEMYVDLYARLLHGLLNGGHLKEGALKTLEHPALGGARKVDVVRKISQEASRYMADSEQRLSIYQSATGHLGSACYIQGAMSSMLMLAHEFCDDFSQGVLTNANCGGENAHRGAALGALLGAAAAVHGPGVPNKWKDGLNSAKVDLQKVVTSRI